MSELIDQDSWKESVRKALAGLPKSVLLTDIAEEIGVDVTKLYNLTSKGSLNPDDIKRVETWLINKGYVVPEAPPDRTNEHSSAYGEGKDPATLLIEELRFLAHYIESPGTTHEQKKRKFRSFLDGYIDGWDEFVASIDEKKVANNAR